MILALLFAAQQVPEVHYDPTDRMLPVSAQASVISTFRKGCFDPFPDTAKVEAAMGAQPGFRPYKPASDFDAQVQALMPSHMWMSQGMTVRFIARGVSSRDMPDPQCTVMATVAGDQQPEALFSQIAGELGLPAGKVVGKKRYRTSMWDIARPEGRHWRVVAGTQQGSDGLHLRLSMLNLAPESRS